jgi:hypothetical protein
MIEPFSYRLFNSFGPVNATVSGSGTQSPVFKSEPMPPPTVFPAPGGGGFMPGGPIDPGNPAPAGNVGGTPPPNNPPSPNNPTNEGPDPNVVVGAVAEIPLGGVGNTSPDAPIWDKIPGIVERNKDKLVYVAIGGVALIAILLFAFKIGGKK